MWEDLGKTSEESFHKKEAGIAALKEQQKQQEQVVEQTKKNWEQTSLSASESAKHYEHMYEAFLKEQAGILAENLSAGCPCPVCGSTVHPDPAKLSDHAVTELEVEQAKKTRAAAEEKRDMAYAAFEAEKTEKQKLEPVGMGTAFPFLKEKNHVVSIIGGGGKTTLLYEMAGFCVKNDQKVLVTTSTHIYRPPKEWHDQSLEAVERKFRTGRAAIIGSACRDPEKLSMPETELFEEARKKADLTLIEADGARHLPCKAPAEHEPALLSSSDLVIGVTGLSALGQPLGKGCFRAERAAELLDCTMEHHITEEDLARLIASEQGQQKDLKGRTFYAVLHQYEEKEHRAAAEKLVELLRRQGIEHVLVTCATGNRRQSGENTNPWYGRAELPVREAEEEWEPGE